MVREYLLASNVNRAAIERYRRMSKRSALKRALQGAATAQSELMASHHSGEFALALAVLKLAHDDLKSGRPGARGWWTSRHSTLALWCEVTDLDPETARKHALNSGG